MNLHYDKDLHLLKGLYNDSFDIEKFHGIVCNVIKAKQQGSIIGVIQDGTLTKPSIMAFSNIIEKMADCTDLTYYTTKAAPWIKAILKVEGAKKVTLLECYFKMTSKYVNLDLKNTNKVENEIVCIDCDSIIDPEDDVCKTCGCIQTKFISSTFYGQPESTSIVKTTKTTLDKFMEKYLRYQGRLDVIINHSDVEQIKTYLNEKYNILNTKEAFRSKNLFLLRDAMTFLSLKKYKDDINIIMNMLWDYKIPNYTAYDELIKVRWSEGTEVITLYKKEDELQNITHNEWRLYRELNDLGIDCDPVDFEIINNKEIRKKLDKLWKLRCESLNRPYKPLE